MIRASAFALCSVLSLTVGSMALAIQSPSVLTADDKTAEGTIKSVDLTGNRFVISVGIGNDKKDVTVTINESTKYTLDSKDSTRDLALAVGNTAKVTHTNNVATKVDARTPKKP